MNNESAPATPPQQTPQKKWWRRLLIIIFAAVALFFIGTLSVSFAILDSERGTQWSLQFIHRILPNLNIVNARGTWQRGLFAQQIAWRDNSTDIEIDTVELNLHWPLLLRGEVHLPKLHAQTLRIISKGPSDDKPIVLPTLFLPTILSTPDLSIQQLDIVDDTSTFSLHDLRSGVRWQATTLQLISAQIQYQQFKLNASGNIGFRGDYPLRLKGQLHSPQWPDPISLQTAGNLRKLQLQATTAAPYAIAATAQLATLDKDLPLKIHAELSKPFAQTIGSDRVDISIAKIDAQGDLNRIEGTTSIALNDSRYGAGKIDGNFSWQSEHLQTQLQWQSANGNLHMQCDTNLNRPISAVCNGNANSIALTPWLGGQTGVLSSTIKLEAKWSEPQWSLALALPDLQGQFNGDAITGNIAVRTDDGSVWQLQQSVLRIGPNEFKGNGKIGANDRLSIDINVRDIAHLDKEMAGAVAGNIALQGDLPTPTVRAQLQGERLQFRNMHAAQIRLDLFLPRLGNEAGRGRIDMQGFAIAEIVPLNLTLTMRGDRKLQDWVLFAQQNNNRATLQCKTQSDSAFDNWQMNCPEFSGRMRFGNSINESWHNTEALRGRAQVANKQFELSPVCLRGDDVEFCLDETFRYANAKIFPVAAHARGIPLYWAKPWLPDDFMLIGDARISAQAKLNSVSPLNAQASAEIPQTRWRWHTATTVETAEINAIHFDASLDEKRALLSTSAQSPTIGRINANLAINDPLKQRELDGHVDIAQLQLAGLAWAFQGLDSISGEINGSVGIFGTADAPQLRGQLLLKDGNALWAPLGAPFRNMHADLTFNNDSAKLGGWFALGEGGGDIDGNINWDNAGDNWKLRIGVVAGGLSAMPLPNSTVFFSPHAELNAQPGEAHIDGYIDIAKAEIQLKELPPQTTDVTQDQEIVGQKPEEEALKVWLKLGLNLGDQFHLTGFGADVNLSGRLELTRAPGDNMHLQGEVKVPRGRYRAYGQRLTVRRGSVIFYGPFDNPDLSLEAVRDMPPGVTDVVGLRVIGSLKTPEAILFSEPSMPDSDIAYYLLTGHKPVAGATGASGYSASGALLSLGLAGSESKAGQLAQRFGITDLQLGTSDTSNGNKEAEISGQLGKDLYVRYGRGLGEQSNSISFQYRLTPKLMIETISGIEDALDLLYSFEIK